MKCKYMFMFSLKKIARKELKNPADQLELLLQNSKNIVVKTIMERYIKDMFVSNKILLQLLSEISLSF